MYIIFLRGAYKEENEHGLMKLLPFIEKDIKKFLWLNNNNKSLIADFLQTEDYYKNLKWQHDKKEEAWILTIPKKSLTYNYLNKLYNYAKEEDFILELQGLYQVKLTLKFTMKVNDEKPKEKMIKEFITYLNRVEESNDSKKFYRGKKWLEKHGIEVYIKNSMI